MKASKRSWLAAFLLALLGSGALARIPEEALLNEAQAAIQRGEAERLARIAEALGEHPLSAWLELHRLILRMEKGSDEGVEAFLARHEGSYLAERVRAEWVRFRMRAQDWAGALREHQRLRQPDGEMQCRGIDLRERLGDERAALEAEGVLLRGAFTPACQALLARLGAARKLSAEALWAALRGRLARGNLKEAKLVASWLEEGPSSRDIDDAEKEPLARLARLDKAAGRAHRELALFALQKLARSDARIAATRLVDLEAALAREERAFLWGRLALVAARAHLQEALPWFDKAVALGAVLDEEQQAWRVRAALRAQDWGALGRALAGMGDELVSRPEWQYWRAHWLAHMGAKEKAQEILLRLAEDNHFYALLAQEALGRRLRLPEPAAAVTEEEIRALAAHADLVRGLALIRAGWRSEGVRSWNWGLMGLGDRELLAAAEYARREGVFDRAIAAAERTQHEHDFRLRYPLPFYREASPLIRAARLDPAWVYGLMRQESRFVLDATSRAGAKGLMQLMPATAKWVAKKIGMNDFHPGKTTDLSTNVVLGTSYLRLVLDALDEHPVLAAAAYNAGPNRAKRWRAQSALDAVIYIETIPFDETRDYVKKVLANTVHYTALMTGKAPSLRAWLAPIPPAGLREDVTDLP
ncbi:MAG: lytic transglycosylase domain-containing protein [Rhodocyclaceae bacterium]|nr:lytic transglycosylase domain-containing protein [Rhodocyclaceae bacterium]